MTDDNRPETLEPLTEVEEPEASDSSAEAASPTAESSDEIRRERDEYYDLVRRKTAELDNYRKRVERERAERDQAAAIDLLAELLPLIDDLERALAAAVDTDTVRAYRTGVELIHHQLVGILTQRGVAPIETQGKPFDPHYHQAIAHEVSDDHREGQIIDEVRRGYTIGGRLLRPAMVRVAKG